jgi:curli biogenesis system outer membrane secretion channel CsgG
MKKAWLSALVALGAMLPMGAAAQSAKPVVAVVRIDDLTKSGQADTLSTMIESAVAGTGRFRLIERQQLGKLVGEQARARGGVVTTNNPGAMGGFEGVDYLIYGTITSLSAKSAADIGSNLVSGLFGNKNANCTATSATLALDIKITDADSGEIKYVTRINETQRAQASCEGKSNIDAALLMRSASEKVASGLVTSIYPIQVAAVQGDGTIVLNYGDGAVQPGAVMAVYAKGQEIRDPTTGEVLGADEQKLGMIRVTTITGRTSRAVPAGPFSAGIPVGALVRPATVDEIKAAARAGKGK